MNAITGPGPPMFTGTVRDITDRRRAEREREEARRQLEAILQGVADAVTAQAPDGRLLFANDAAAASLGFSTPEELMSAPMATIMDRFDVLEDDGRPFPLEALPGRRALAGEDDAELIVRFRVRETGEERWSAVKATPIRDERGNVTMAINVIEDITTHKRAELAQRFLARSGEVLASSLNADDLLTEVAEMAVPDVADWCVVDVVAESGRLERKALAHVDPDVLQRAIDLGERYPPDPNAPVGVHQVVRSGQAELYPEIPTSCFARGGRRRALPPAHRDRHALGDHRADDHARPDARRADLRERSLGPAVRRAGRGARARAGSPLRDGDRQRASTRSARISPERSSRACCRSSCRTSPASKRPPDSAPPARATRSAATSTTCSRPATAAGRW